MNSVLFVSLIISAISGLFALTRQLQMLQQNSYFPSRYTSWLISNIPLASTGAFLISSVLFNYNLYYVQAIFLLAVAISNISYAIKTQKISIKKLVFTGRIKRMFGCAVLICTVLILLFIVFKKPLLSNLCAVILFTLTFLSPIMTYLCWVITLPIEKAFSRWYINDAKRILKSYKNLKIIGITGSYGKTTTKFILTRILSEKYNVVCTPHSFNTPMGVVRTIREHLKPQTQIFVCEMGAKNVGDIKEICDIVNPTHALITSVGAQHLETFKSVDNVFKTKFELANAVKLKKGEIFVNGDSEGILSRIDTNEFTVYGTDSCFEISAQNITYGRFGSEFTVRLGEENINLSTKLLGMHSIINIVGACALAYSLGVSAKDIQYAVASLKPTEHRLEMKSSIAGSIMIDDAYNANPEGSIEAVRVLGSFEGMQKVIITPGLIELGETEYNCNFNLGLETADKCDIIIFVGLNRSKPLVDAVNTTDFDKSKMFVASSFKEAMEIYSRFADKNTVLLIENDLPDNYLY